MNAQATGQTITLPRPALTDLSMPRSKRIVVGFWIATAFFCLQMGFTAYAQLSLPQVAEMFTHLGFPDYFRVELSWAKLLGVVVLLAPVPAWSGFLVPPVDGRITKAVTLSSVKWPWLGAAAGDLVVLRASVGRHRSVADLQREDDELVDLVMAELTLALGVTGRPADWSVTRWGGALPQYTVGHVDRMSQVASAAAAVPGLALCGAAYAGVGIAACVAGAQQAAAGILEQFGLVPVSEA